MHLAEETHTHVHMHMHTHTHTQNRLLSRCYDLKRHFPGERNMTNMAARLQVRRHGGRRTAPLTDKEEDDGGENAPRSHEGWLLTKLRLVTAESSNMEPC